MGTETARLLEFAEGSWHPLGGFARQDDRGVRMLDAPVELWLTGRMTHVYALGALLGYPGSVALAEHGLTALSGLLRDTAHGGWYPRVGWDGPITTDKECYQHAFVVLAAASASIAGLPGGRELLDDALELFENRFWSDPDGMLRETWDEEFQTEEAYRGVNANMHGVEAFLAAFDATGDARWADHARRITDRVVREFTAPNGWRIPEHFDPAWHALPEYNADKPDDPFRPYGSTIGHGLEWARLCLQLRVALGADTDTSWLVDGARELCGRAVADGWAVDGAPGFVYTVDWHGTPVVHLRMHWVLAEAVGTAAALHAVTGDDAYLDRYRQWWEYAEEYLLDRDLGSWHHELDRNNRPSAVVWPGKVDAYHAVQATLLPRLPLRPSIAGALRDTDIELPGAD
ncbi:AGE family epimerase/isomerase [Pseudonocardia eucalypti]|uniref:AGE family epimerase/isomerase n=1 Tax=Pseudonocardia eucalypti TaxID=648755 RepID=A0ABP9PDY8_9PSEU|nr:mannose/cellobiose epimerase-like protein (N-acyl-D-glucosamine 2-epimerase family) [Pseudonocardia eucalypti]